MIRPMAARRQASVSWSRHRAEEDFLDWCENQARRPEEIRRLDRVFCIAWSAITLLWMAPVAIYGAGAATKLASLVIAAVTR